MDLCGGGKSVCRSKIIEVIGAFEGKMIGDKML